MKLSAYTKPELEVFRDNCNFTDDERTVFENLSKGKSATYIAIKMCVAERTVYRIEKRVKDKIERVNRGE